MIKETTIVKLKYEMQTSTGEKLKEQHSEVTINGEDNESKIFNQYLNNIKNEENIVGKKDKIYVDGFKLFGEVDRKKSMEIPSESLGKIKEDISVGGILNFNINGNTLEGLIIAETKEGGVIVDFNNPYAGKKFIIDLEVIEVKD